MPIKQTDVRTTPGLALAAEITARVTTILCIAGCSAPGAPGSGRDAASWVGTVTTAGHVTTVVNQSGSVWGGPVALNEVLSIGQPSGEEPYLFGVVRAVGATEERIYVLDLQVALVRVYDQTGIHLFDFGGRGQGPGFFAGAMSIGVDPSGRVLVQERSRVSVFDLDGNFIETWPYVAGGVHPLVVRLDGGAFISSGRPPAGSLLQPWLAISRDGTEERRITADPTYDPSLWYLTSSQGGQRLVPHRPVPLLAPTPSGAFVHGTSDTYRFEIDYPDGSKTIVENPDDRVSVSVAEKEWLTRNRTAMMRQNDPGWSWNANPIPDYRPAFERFLGDRHGRLWVHRSVGVVTRPDCNDDPQAIAQRPPPRPCWNDGWGFDLFDEASGRLLGRVELPDGYQPSGWPALLADGIIVVVEDAAGTIKVKRYRLVLPSRQGERAR